MFDITKNKFSGRPEIASAILQKMATRSNVVSQTFDIKVFSRPEYKAILRQIKENAKLLSNKNLVDSIFGLGKLHKYQKMEELNKYGDFKFF